MLCIYMLQSIQPELNSFDMWKVDILAENVSKEEE